MNKSAGALRRRGGARLAALPDPRGMRRFRPQVNPPRQVLLSDDGHQVPAPPKPAGQDPRVQVVHPCQVRQYSGSLQRPAIPVAAPFARSPGRGCAPAATTCDAPSSPSSSPPANPGQVRGEGRGGARGPSDCHHAAGELYQLYRGKLRRGPWSRRRGRRARLALTP